MLKKFILGLAVAIILLTPLQSYSQVYGGIGLDMALPMGKFKDVNQQSFGLNLQMESRAHCKVWWGLRVDFLSFQKKDGLDINLDYYENAILISPKFRYCPFIEDCYNTKLIPYLQAMFTISSIGDTKGDPRLGLGGAAGLGVALGFDLFEKCWMLDLGGLYSAPNFIERTEKRPSLEMILVSLTLSMQL